LRRASDAKPNRKALLMRSGEDALAGERRAEAPVPDGMGRLAKLEEEVEFLGKERVIVVLWRRRHKKVSGPIPTFSPERNG
jgi:hypothetical protein